MGLFNKKEVAKIEELEKENKNLKEMLDSFGGQTVLYVFYSLNYSADDNLDGSGRSVTSLNMLPCAYRTHAQFMDSSLFKEYAQTYCGIDE